MKTEKKYCINNILLKYNNLGQAFLTQIYTNQSLKELKDYFLNIPKGKYRRLLNLDELEHFTDLIAKALRLKHKGRLDKIINDKTKVAQAYFKLFEFVKMEKIKYQILNKKERIKK